MEEKNAKKISLSMIFLIIAIIAMIVMGIFIYKLNKEKTAEIQKSSELQAQVNSVNETIAELQGTISNISTEINKTKTNENTAENNNNTVSQQSSPEKSSSLESSTSVSNSSKESASSKIIGTWKASKVVDSSGNDLELSSVFGTGIGSSNEMIFKENGAVSYMIGITASSDDGEYTVNGNTIKYGVPTDIKGVMNWKTLTYIPEEDILKEEIDFIGEKHTVTYIRAN